MEENKRTLITIVSAFVCIVILIFAGILGEKHINATEYISVSYYGANGYASAHCEIDRDAIFEYLAKNEKNQDKLDIYRAFANSFMAETQTEYISNGDKVKISVTYDEEVAKKAGITVGERKYTVRAKDIESGNKIDLFSNVHVVFAGISPSAYIVINNDWEDEYLSRLEFEANKVSGIQTNDEIVIKCLTDINELAKNGYLVETNEYTIKADYLSSYVAGVEQIDMNVINNIAQIASETIVSQTEDKSFRMMYKATSDKDFLYRSNDESASNVTLIDRVFMHRNNPNEGNYENFIYMIFSTDITSGEDEYPVFFAFEFTQGYVTIDGDFNISSDEIEKRYDCSLSYENLYDTYITSKADMYECVEIE